IASGAIRGTEFHIAVADNGRTEVTLLDGEVALSNDQGEVTLQNGDQAVVEPGQAPRKSPALATINIIQWWLYYPAVVDPGQLGLSEDEKQTLTDSLAAYNSGDLLKALESYPPNRQPASDAERVYHAALLLTAGQVQPTEAVLSALPSPLPTAQALRQVIA